jgi:flagellin-like protein
MNYRKNEEAVSPVIGVILMVVITVIIAALMAAFAFGMGAPVKAPTASIKVISTDTLTAPGTIRLQHTGGDSLRLDNVKLIIEQTDSAGVVLRTTVDKVDTSTPPSKFVTGDTMEITADGSAITLNNLATTLAPVPIPATGLVVLAPASDVTISLIDIPTGQEISTAHVSI